MADSGPSPDDLVGDRSDRATDDRLSATVARLYRDRGPALRRFFRHRLSNRDDADDMVQEVFVRLARDDNASALRNPAAWLQRVARNLVFDVARRSEVRQASMRVSLHEAELPPVAPTQMLDLEARDMLRRFEEALSTLSERSCQVFRLHRIDELSYREIATHLGISVATVEYHMMRALAHLDRALGDD
ncbi:MAG: RNA polymerase sigma factor [Rhodospirillaceae bacterium]|nr:RNA polymerase sigma factor [Rhodospirillaceae bacterium]